jgi:hypothetical protein
VVALNASARCRKFFNSSGTGSLVIQPDIEGDAHLAKPFTIGRIDPRSGYVHVFDDVTLNIILRELDRITDFTRYLTRKEAVIGSGKLGGAAGEEELLAHYLTELNEAGVHDIIVPKDVDAAWFVEGSWDSVATDPRYAAKQRADRQSYAWDNLIETFSKHMVAGTLATGNERALSDHELGVRVMASEPRLSRRSLVGGLVDLLLGAPPNKDATRLVLSDQAPTRGYVSVISPQRVDQSYERYRERRTAILAAYCHVAKVKSPQLPDIVGIATEPAGVIGRSEDLVYLNARLWTAEDDAETRELQARTGILLNPRKTWFHDDEYPEITATVARPVGQQGNRKQRRAAHARARKKKK